MENLSKISSDTIDQNGFIAESNKKYIIQLDRPNYSAQISKKRNQKHQNQKIKIQKVFHKINDDTIIQPQQQQLNQNNIFQSIPDRNHAKCKKFHTIKDESQNLYDVPQVPYDNITQQKKSLNMSFYNNNNDFYQQSMSTYRTNRSSSSSHSQFISNTQTLNNIQSCSSSSERIVSVSNSIQKPIKLEQLNQQPKQKLYYKDIIIQGKILDDQYNQITHKKWNNISPNKLGISFDNPNIKSNLSVESKEQEQNYIQSLNIENNIDPQIQENHTNFFKRHIKNQRNSSFLNVSSESQINQIQTEKCKALTYFHSSEGKLKQNQIFQENKIKQIKQQPQEESKIKSIKEQYKTLIRNDQNNKSNLRQDKKLLTLTKQQKLAIEQQQKLLAQHEKQQQSNDLNLFKITINRCLEKLKYQQRFKNSSMIDQQSKQNEKNECSIFQNSQNDQYKQIIKRKISYQDDFLDNIAYKSQLSPQVLALKKGYSLNHASSPTLSCESPLSAKIKNQISVFKFGELDLNKTNSIKPKTTTLDPIPKPFINRRRRSQMKSKENKTQIFTDSPINKTLIREKTIQQVGQLAKYDWSNLNRSPCIIFKKATTTVQKESKFEKLMKRQSILSKFEEINHLLSKDFLHYQQKLTTQLEQK